MFLEPTSKKRRTIQCFRQLVTKTYRVFGVPLSKNTSIDSVSSRWNKHFIQPICFFVVEGPSVLETMFSMLMISAGSGEDMVEIQSIKRGSGCCTRQLPPWPFTSLYSIAGVLCSTIIGIDLLLVFIGYQFILHPRSLKSLILWDNQPVTMWNWMNKSHLPAKFCLKSCSSAVSKIWRSTCHRSFIQPLFLLENSTHNGQSINGKSSMGNPSNIIKSSISRWNIPKFINPS